MVTLVQQRCRYQDALWLIPQVQGVSCQACVHDWHHARMQNFEQAHETPQERRGKVSDQLGLLWQTSSEERGESEPWVVVLVQAHVCHRQPSWEGMEVSVVELLVLA